MRRSSCVCSRRSLSARPNEFEGCKRRDTLCAPLMTREKEMGDNAGRELSRKRRSFSRDARHAARSHALVGARGQRGAAAPGGAAPVRARAVAALLRRPGGFWLGGAGPWQHSCQCRRGAEQNGWYPRAVHRRAEGLQAAQALRLEQGPLPSPALPLPRPASRSQLGLAQKERMGATGA